MTAKPSTQVNYYIAKPVSNRYSARSFPGRSSAGGSVKPWGQQQYYPMEVLYFMIPLAVIVAVVIALFFFWSVKSGQFDDLEGPAHAILMDDDRPQAGFDSSDKNRDLPLDSGETTDNNAQQAGQSSATDSTPPLQKQ